MVFAQDPEHVFADLVIEFIAHLFFEPLEFLLAQSVKAFSIILGHMKTVDDDLAFDVVVTLEKIGGSFQVAIPHVGCDVFDGWAHESAGAEMLRPKNRYEGAGIKGERETMM